MRSTILPFNFETSTIYSPFYFVALMRLLELSITP
nr:MAG TPA: hypothetical protein [Caudoviricetes sp.]DAS53015.1 MAG TPA: hypothetical protein [Caudoviricetes sp.]